VRKKNGEYDLAVDNFNRPLLVLARSTTDKNSIVKQLQVQIRKKIRDNLYRRKKLLFTVTIKIMPRRRSFKPYEKRF